MESYANTHLFFPHTFDAVLVQVVKTWTAHHGNPSVGVGVKVQFRNLVVGAQEQTDFGPVAPPGVPTVDSAVVLYVCLPCPVFQKSDRPLVLLGQV